VKTFGQRVRHARLRYGWTQKELAHASGLAQSAIGNYESGQRTEPSGAALLRLASALDVSPLWLSSGEGGMELPEAAPAGAGRGRARPAKEAAAAWPFRTVSYESFQLLSTSDKKLLESLVGTFVRSCAEGR